MACREFEMGRVSFVCLSIVSPSGILILTMPIKMLFLISIRVQYGFHWHHLHSLTHTIDCIQTDGVPHTHTHTHTHTYDSSPSFIVSLALTTTTGVCLRLRPFQ